MDLLRPPRRGTQLAAQGITRGPYRGSFLQTAQKLAERNYDREDPQHIRAWA
ncbi:hypothetical protein HH1059_06450 [Halorhodospira halochloris]|uniref:Uncharacterized protein n=1 Tax=Halorhodospira halochloris TaxID=1052 RepID=A0A2Z6EZD5_HALHR|nr:hypothetical protein HH1059_06450 [Halorhodospira halochloris]